jgi:hypothetical protein
MKTTNPWLHTDAEWDALIAEHVALRSAGPRRFGAVMVAVGRQPAPPCDPAASARAERDLLKIAAQFGLSVDALRPPPRAAAPAKRPPAPRPDGFRMLGVTP